MVVPFAFGLSVPFDNSFPKCSPCTDNEGLLAKRWSPKGEPRMTSSESVTYWILQLKEGERDAVQKLWEGYFSRARPQDSGLAAAHVGQDRRCRRHRPVRLRQLLPPRRAGTLPQAVRSRRSLAIAHSHYLPQGLRSGEVRGPAPATHGRVYVASRLPTEDSDDEDSIFSSVINREPDPALVAEMAESCRRLLEILPDPVLRDIAVWKMEGYTNEEIAPKLKGGGGGPCTRWSANSLASAPSGRSTRDERMAFGGR